MKKNNKLVIGGLSLVVGSLLLSGCTKSFCTVDDQAHMMYMFDYGVTEYYDNAEQGSQLFAGNDNIYVSYTALDKMSEKSGIGAANAAAAQSGAPIPSQDFWKAVDTVVLDKALAKAGYDKSTVTYSQLFTSLNDYGYLKFAGTEDDNSLFAYFDTVVNEASALVSFDDCPTQDYITSYKASLTNTIATYRSCFTIDEGDYGYYGYESGTGFRPQPDTVKMSAKTWGNAWKQGLFQGLLVYPIAWVTESFVNLFSGNNPANLAGGVPQILALLLVTIIVRGLMLLLTFKSTAATSKMQLIQPEIAKIQAKYPNSNTNRNDQQRMAMEMQALYKKHGINPFSSLVVLIVQFPVFICVWGALQSSASLSTGSFLGLNLSSSISSVIFNGASWKNGSAFTALGLFLLMAGAQVVSMLLPRILQKKQTKNVSKLGVNPTQKEQESKTKTFTIVMMVMIIVMGFTLVSAMGVYWLVGALFSVAQTLITNAVGNKKKKSK
ncbi:MAG: membrane protein insertase YidC [Bacilli bacterium]|nr:membrane protein insertase YidC [Bacilli bacterium]